MNPVVQRFHPLGAELDRRHGDAGVGLGRSDAELVKIRRVAVFFFESVFF